MKTGYVLGYIWKSEESNFMVVEERYKISDDVPVVAVEAEKFNRLKEIIQASNDIMPSEWYREALNILEGRD